MLINDLHPTTRLHREGLRPPALHQQEQLTGRFVDGYTDAGHVTGTEANVRGCSAPPALFAGIFANGGIGRRVVALNADHRVYSTLSKLG